MMITSNAVKNDILQLENQRARRPIIFEQDIALNYASKMKYYFRRMKTPSCLKTINVI
jgi:hypothetical protein